ncbi:killer cell lectin-like receptor subfamily B member 1B allele A isoform X3 [Oenanthe melanoleuca]|uniref:killer cell lectin-like receptor subfamily B member 1B allele A isoform X3 n=1 Tax=Oenanthe melanoleuca TaxID=2939378 RepID=UPI0024C20099|nr:killer cell lectin-like receptor subfamily B member 1B allele A isoform X3 [Oenanthe melanoleuca]
MAENVVYVNWNLPEPSRPRILTDPDGQGKSRCPRALSPRVAALAAVLAVMMLLVLIALYLTLRAGSQQDSTTLTSTSQNVSTALSPTSQEDSTMLPPIPGEAPGNRPCSRAHIAVLVVVLLLAVLALTLAWTLPGGPIANSQQDSTPLSPTSQQDSTELPPSHGETPGCPSEWKKHERKCYFFSPERKKKSWKSSRAECTAMGSDLVIIESREELTYLLSQSGGSYYFLGLRYSPQEQNWKWINNVEHDPAMFSVKGNYSDYHCTTIGFGEIGAAPCSGTRTTQNMCEKSATISRRHQES